MPNAGDVEYYEGKIVDFTVAEGEAIKKGNLVAITGDWEISQALKEDMKAIGVALNDGDAGEKVEVLLMSPIIYMVAQGAVVAGEFLTASRTVAGAVTKLATGRTVVWVVVVGLTIEGAGDGEVFPMMIFRGVFEGAMA